MSDIGEGIQLHFCQSCGISIPQPDIDSGRARPAPGGYVCAGCVYQARDLDLAVGEQPTLSRTDPRSGGGVLMAIAMLYVVGVATFLLVKELQRETPTLDLGNVATESRLQQLSRRIDEIDSQARGALQELKENDDQLGRTIGELGARIAALNGTAAKMSRLMETQVQGLRRAILDLTDRTVGVKGGIDEVLRKLNELEDRVSQDPGPGIGPAVTQEEPNAKDNTQPPRKSREDLEKERQLAEFIAKLQDRKASDQTRYNAAVQLGDLQHVDSVAALQVALEKDPNNLVRRAAAWSLGMLGRLGIPAIPTLVKELGGKEEYVGYMCERALGEITKAATGKPVTFNYDPTMSRSERRKIQKRWEEWWTKNRESLMPK